MKSRFKRVGFSVWDLVTSPCLTHWLNIDPNPNGYCATSLKIKVHKECLGAKIVI